MTRDALWRKRARDEVELRREVEALQLLGPGIVRLVDVEGDVLVLERIDPGWSAAQRSGDEATAAIAATLPSLWTPLPPGCRLPSVASECRSLYDERAVGPLPAGLVAAARRQLTELLRDPPDDRVLHGDLHAGNLLWSDERGWVAIDPHGVVGDPAYDVGPLLINPWDGDARALLDRRLTLLSDALGMAVDRLAGWGLVRAVLAEAWHVQDTGRVAGGPLRVAHALAVLSLPPLPDPDPPDSS